MYPYFDLAHAALCCLAVRDDLANGILIFIIATIIVKMQRYIVIPARLPTLLPKAPFGALVFNHAGHLCR